MKNATSITAHRLQKQDSPKQIWFITYGAACQSITPEMLKSSEIVVDQCYTAVWRESKYTLFHLPRQHRARHSAISKSMDCLQREYGIILGVLCGFDSIASNGKGTDEESLETHPGFKLMLNALNSPRRDEQLQWWTEIDEDITENRKGLLWKYIEDMDVSKLTKAQLFNRAKEWIEITKENKRLKASNEFLAERLQETERMLKETIISRDNHFRSGEECFKMLQAKIEECGMMQRQLLQMRLSHENVDTEHTKQ